MPHVFTLEGPNLSALGAAQGLGVVSASGSGMTVVHYPQYGTPLAPAGDPIGPARPETPVFGPGGTPVMYRRRFPARGPVCDYCEPNIIAISNGLGDDAPQGDFFLRQTDGALAAIMLGGTLVGGALLGGYAYWLRRRILKAKSRG